MPELATCSSSWAEMLQVIVGLPLVIVSVALAIRLADRLMD